MCVQQMFHLKLLPITRQKPPLINHSLPIPTLPFWTSQKMHYLEKSKTKCQTTTSFEFHTMWLKKYLTASCTSCFKANWDAWINAYDNELTMVWMSKVCLAPPKWKSMHHEGWMINGQEIVF